ncbi:MAG: Na+/H+ antiporter NhaC family protein [Eubacteriales bacterium]|nr:Na+/H+ antiporter NhaC family protein [Eubacteriales bacterium]
MDAIWTTMEEWGKATEFNYGILVLLPIIVCIGIALWTKDTYVSFIAACIVAFLMAAKGHPLVAMGLFMDQMYVTICDADVVWVLLIVVLFAAVIQLLTDSGGVLGFAAMAKRFLKTRNQTLLGTWILGIIVFIDDYLNCLAVGAAIKPLADEHKISREMLAYIINSTGVTVCAIVPISSWGGYFSGLMKEAGLNGGLSAFGAYSHSIPYMFYAIIAVVIVPLIFMKILPMFGPMKKAEKRAIETGECLSEDARKTFQQGLEDETRFEGKSKRAINFVLPILAIAGFFLLTEDLVPSLVMTIILCFIMYVAQRLMNPIEFCASMFKGMTDMFGLVVLIILAFMFIDANELMGLNDYVTKICQAHVSAAIFPFIVFIGMGLMSFASGCVWTLAAIAFPICGTAALALGCDPFLINGALISACAFGGHICMYSDTVLLTAASTQATNVDYFKTSIPIVAAYPFAIGSILFLVFGFIMAP